MDSLSPSSDVQRVVVMAGAQIGKTSIGLNWLGYIISQAPGPVLAVQPTVEMAKRFSRQRLDPLFEESAALRGLIRDPRSRDSGNTMLAKEFPGGTLILTGSNSPTGLRSMPVRYLFLDEVDGFPPDASGEGDPVDLATRRTETFSRRKILMTSTPTLTGFSRIEAAFNETDQRRYFVPCPACGDMAPLSWSRVKWPEGRPHEAGVTCDECGAVATDRDKPKMLAGGEWRATVEGADPRVAGFHLNALYSPWVRWGDVAAEHVRVAKDPARLQVFVNTRLGESWEDKAGDTIKESSLIARREDLGAAVPNAVTVVTVGVDVQDDRLEVQFVGWGADEESWVLDYRVLPGDPAGARLWNTLDSLLSRPMRRADGVELPVEAVAIDSGGHHTKSVYDFCRPRLGRRIWAVKGAGGAGIPVWPKRVSRVDGKAGRCPLWRVGVDAAKDALFARLRVGEPGPGYVHFGTGLDPEYFRQLTGERVVTKFVRGRPVRSWQPRMPGARLEALDSYVYAMAALHGLLAMGFRLGQPAPTAAAPAPPPPPSDGWIGDTRDSWI